MEKNADQIEIQRIAMKGLIVDEHGRILILREADESYSEGTNAGKWQLPGGRIQLGEKWEDGLIREMEEETGLADIEVVRPVAVGEWRPTIKGIRTQIIAVFHLCYYKSGKIKLSEEHDQFSWIDESDLEKYNFTVSEKQILKRALNLRIPK
ncbi:NUDIX domain-containing protein [Candidatus Saccharibacteria bacterium]|jgi:8-oxo-dGTP diphosphatase|nr:NUDIX domain-containing protein [Candidatus Saccharibacteria bacterium]